MKPAEREREELDTEQLASDLTNLLVADTLQFLRGNVQTLQAITGFVLAAYVALLVAVWKQENVQLDVLSAAVSFGPVALFVASAALIVTKAVTYKGSDITAGDLTSAVSAYSRALDARRSQLVKPGVLTGLGILAGAGALLFLVEQG